MQKHEANILIVEDEEDIRDILQFNLENEGFTVDTAESAEAALQILNTRHRLILLDVMMSGISGFKLAARLRKEGNNTPIIFLTAKNTENDMLTGFSIGGDDFITKPFSVKNVIARVCSVLKRSEAHSPQTVAHGGLLIDEQAKTVRLDGKILSLTRTEYNILRLLVTNEGKFFSRTDILGQAWGDDSGVFERTVDVHITRLRKKLGPYSENIICRRGYGYMFTRAKPHIDAV
ncbi:MAG: response regulator transcription factor, partial [Tannerella sp.]|nr:response regulator transcription factor [Tannerella sp.]